MFPLMPVLDPGRPFGLGLPWFPGLGFVFILRLAKIFPFVFVD